MNAVSDQHNNREEPRMNGHGRAEPHRSESAIRIRFLLFFAICVGTLPVKTTAQPSFDPPPRIKVEQRDYSSNIGVVREAQEQALQEARQLLERIEDPGDRPALDSAIGEMERAKSALEAARTNPAQLAPALAAQQAAYEALLKLLPREFGMTRSRNAGQNAGAGQPNPRELDQLDMPEEENRYETERQATALPDEQQRARVQAADRLRQLAQRQQDLNDRLRELQTALQEAAGESKREEIRRELKRLQEEQRRMLADLDELRQRLAQAPNSEDLAQARQQLDQARSDAQRAAEELGREAPSQALAAGSRAQQSMRQVREDLRRTTSSQFTEQMRQLRNQARDLAAGEDEVARNLETMANSERRSLDDSSERQALARQLANQQNVLTNLFSNMRVITEQSETLEPLLSQQLYDALRRADQGRPVDRLATAAELLDRGFAPQAGEVEGAARQSIDQLRQDIDRAAQSVLGNEADALRYAQSELQRLGGQVEREMNRAQTNSPAAASGPGEQEPNPEAEAPNLGNRQQLRQFVEELSRAGGNSPGGNSGPITGNNYTEWLDRMREVEQVLDSAELRSQLATVRERMGVMREVYRETGRPPETGTVRNQILIPMARVRTWLQEEIARLDDTASLVPLDRDPVPDKFSDLVRRYYEKLGDGRSESGAQRPAQERD